MKHWLRESSGCGPVRVWQTDCHQRFQAQSQTQKSRSRVRTNRTNKVAAHLPRRCVVQLVACTRHSSSVSYQHHQLFTEHCLVFWAQVQFRSYHLPRTISPRAIKLTRLLSRLLPPTPQSVSPTVRELASFRLGRPACPHLRHNKHP